MRYTELMIWIDGEVKNGLRDMMQAETNADEAQWETAWRKVEALRAIRARMEAQDENQNA